MAQAGGAMHDVRDARELAKLSHLNVIDCEEGLGLLRVEVCAARSLVAQGRRPGEPGIRDSKCKGCGHGARRAAELGGVVAERQFRPGRGGQMKLRRPKRVRPERKIITRTCAREGCGETFEVRTVADANRRYHSEECRLMVQLSRPARPRTRARVEFAPFAPCATIGCVRIVELAECQRHCDICRAQRGELRFRKRHAS